VTRGGIEPGEDEAHRDRAGCRFAEAIERLVLAVRDRDVGERFAIIWDGDEFSLMFRPDGCAAIPSSVR
jgi:hypothetical protein